MSEKDCGSCDYQGRIEQQRVECRVDNEWHKRGHSCENFKEYVQGKTQEEKTSEAREIMRRRQEREADQSRRDFEEKMAMRREKFEKKLWLASWWWQIGLLVFGTLLGIAGTLIVQALKK